MKCASPLSKSVPWNFIKIIMAQEHIFPTEMVFSLLIYPLTYWGHFLIFAMTVKDYKDTLAGRASSEADMKRPPLIFLCVSA
jgi:hypothetical protein